MDCLIWTLALLLLQRPNENLAPGRRFTVWARGSGKICVWIDCVVRHDHTQHARTRRKLCGFDQSKLECLGESR